MKKFFSPLMAILSIVSPICIVGIMCMIETEIIEAVISGLVLGCMVGSVFSIIFWVTNKYKNKILRIISLIPLVFVGLYSLLFILYLAPIKNPAIAAIAIIMTQATVLYFFIYNFSVKLKFALIYLYAKYRIKF